MTYELNKAKATVNMYINDALVCSKFVHSRKEKKEWMREMTNKMKGVPLMYFEVSYVYSARNRPKSEYQREYRENKRIDNILKAIA